MACLPILLSLLMLLTLLSQRATCREQTIGNSWEPLHEDLGEYDLVLTTSAATVMECAMLAGSERAIEHSVKDGGVCRVFACRMGSGGCRKCRNLSNGSLPAVWLASPTFGAVGCWRTFQHRVDDSVDFYRNWTQYLTAFGDGEDANFWMGLRRLHRLTADGDRRVRWEFSLWNDTFYWVENAFFRVGDEAANFVATIGPWDASASNVEPADFQPMSNMAFTTFDRDNDLSITTNCAQDFQGAWWYKSCHAFNPNGRHFNPPYALNVTTGIADWADGVVYRSASGVYPFDYTYSMKTFECMIWSTVSEAV